MIPSGAAWLTTTTTMYQFTHEDCSSIGFVSFERSSTNALYALENWSPSRASGHVVADDQDDRRVARLIVPTSDTHKVAWGFHTLCAHFGTHHETMRP